MGQFDRPHAKLLALVSIALLASAPFATAQEQTHAIPWEEGPVVAQLGAIAEMKIPEGYSFTGKEGTRKLLELTHNLVAGNELGALVPNDSTSTWFVIFQFSDVGYVKDDDKDKIDADALMKSIRAGTEE